MLSNNFSVCSGGFVDGFGDVVGFWEAGTVEPHHAVSDFPASVLDGTGEAVIGAGPAEAEQEAPRLGDTEEFFPESDSGKSSVPLLAHELKAIRRISANRINAISWPRFDDFEITSAEDCVFWWGHFESSFIWVCISSQSNVPGNGSGKIRKDRRGLP